MENLEKRRIQKPIGIYVFCLAIILAHSILQFLYYFWAYQLSDGNLPFAETFISLFLIVFTSFSAVWAMYGDDWSRIALLSIDTFNIGWFVYMVLTIASNSSETNADFFDRVIFFLRPMMFSIPIFFGAWWFFLTKDVVDFYKQNG
jgi:hypothetical protein